jgi:hypothetical protein
MQQQPVSFDIDISKCPAGPAPEVKKRLEANKRKPVSLESINQRLSHAAELRSAVIEKNRLAATGVSEKVELMRERRTSEERSAEEKAAAELSTKLQTAEEKRSVRLERRQGRARNHNKRVAEKVESVSKSAEEDSASKKAELEDKLRKAAELRNTIIEKSRSTAQISLEKFEMNRERRTSEERASEERAAADLNTKLQIAESKRTETLSNRQNAARCHNQRVAEKVEHVTKTTEEELLTKKAGIADKLRKAQEQRESNITRVKQTAAQLAGPKSPQKSDSQ